MAELAGILNQHLTAGQALTGKSAAPMASTASGTASTGSTSSSDSADSSSATISANDFLTLLVTEMQNQDPTADTDPNEYINQLVNVNSLEQLIDINQTLSTDLGSSTASSGSSASGEASGATASLQGKTANNANPQFHTAAQKAAALTAAPSAGTGRAMPAGVKSAPGNLAVPAAGPVAHRVAHALDGRSNAGRLSGVQ